MQLLHIDSSISGDQSVSRQLTASIVARLRQAAPDITVTYRDLFATPVPHHSGAVHNLKLKAAAPDGVLSAEIASSASDASGQAAKRELEQHFAAINAVLNEFLAADVVVLGAPMYNFGIPSQLKTWVDCLAAPGRTFSYSEKGVEGLCGGKRVIVASSRGGFYSPQSPMAALDHQESYLTGFLGFIGIRDIEFVRAEGVNYGPEHRQRAIESALAEVANLKAA